MWRHSRRRHFNVISTMHFLQYVDKKKENRIESSNKWKWCPNLKCNKKARVIKQGKCRDLGNMTVQCLCTDIWCFSCQKERHWPSLCNQREVYYKMIKQNGDETHAVYYAEVKKSPFCRYPMEKSGGCKHMSCRCGHGFCWECLGSWAEHTKNGVRCERGKVTETTIELENEKQYLMPIRCYKLSLKCRKTRSKDLSLLSIKRRCGKYAAMEQVRHFKMSSRQYKIAILKDIVNKSYEEMQTHLLFVRQMYEILEHVYVMMSHMTKKTHSCPIQRLVERLEFCIRRIETSLQHEEEMLSLKLETAHKIVDLKNTTIHILNNPTTLVPHI